jgi:hypothetical protein
MNVPRYDERPVTNVLQNANGLNRPLPVSQM